MDKSLMIADLAVTDMAGEARVRDVDLAVRLGFDRPRDIRKIIERYTQELLRFGLCATVARNRKGQRGPQEVTEYWLNRKQAMFICMRSDTPNAVDVQDSMIRVFDAFTRGDLVSPAYRIPVVLKLMLLEQARDWELLWDQDVVRSIIRLHRAPGASTWNGGRLPQYLSDDYQFIYALLLTKAIYTELRALWVANGSHGTQHMFLTPEAWAIVQKQLPIVGAIADQSSDIADFRRRLEYKYGDRMLQLPLAS